MGGVSQDNAEKCLIGAVCLDAAVFEELAIPADHFYNPRHKAVWAALGDLIAEGVAIDEITLSDRLEYEGKLDAVGGLSYLSECVLSTPTTDNVSFYGDIIRRNWIDRSVASLVADVAAWKAKGYTGDALLELAQKALDKVSCNVVSNRPDAFQGVIDELTRVEHDIANPQDRNHGLGIGLGLDKHVPGGIPRDKVTILFGETGNFKTTTKDNIIDEMARNGHTVLNFSLEDSGELTHQCLLSRLSGVPYGKIFERDLTPTHVRKLNEAAMQHEDMLRRVIPITDFIPKIGEVIRIARQYKRTHGAVAVFIDYVQLLNYGGSDERIALANVIKATQRAAHRDRMAYVLLSQVNRAKMTARNSFIPKLDDLFGSSALQQGCKLAIGVYRPWLYDPFPEKGDYVELSNRDPEAYKSVCELHVVKNRLGATNVHSTVRVTLPTGKMEEYGAQS